MARSQVRIPPATKHAILREKSATCQWAFPTIKIFFFLFLKVDFVFSVKKLAYFYSPPAQAVLKNASTNRFPAACTVCLY
jgi:hypothetical protein